MEWNDITTQVQRMLIEHSLPYEKRQVDGFKLLGFHDNILKKQNELLDFIQLAIFKTKKVDLSIYNRMKVNLEEMH